MLAANHANEIAFMKTLAVFKEQKNHINLYSICSNYIRKETFVELYALALILKKYLHRLYMCFKKQMERGFFFQIK